MNSTMENVQSEPVQLKAVIRGRQRQTVRFIGTTDECYEYMRTHRGWSDLRCVNTDGTLGRLSSWVL